MSLFLSWGGERGFFLSLTLSQIPILYIQYILPIHILNRIILHANLHIADALCFENERYHTVKKISRQALGDWHLRQDHIPRRLFYPAGLHHWGTIIRAGLPAQETQIPRNPTVPAQEAHIPTRPTSPGDTFPQQAHQQRRQISAAGPTAQEICPNRAYCRRPTCPGDWCPNRAY
jgi:hypothetical protein